MVLLSMPSQVTIMSNKAVLECIVLRYKISCPILLDTCPTKKKKKMLGLAQVPGSCWYNDALAKIRVHPFAFPPTIPASLLG